jgi:hypothetical protein
MQPLAMAPTEIAERGADLTGTVITRELRIGRARFRKGQAITDADLPVLAQGAERIHAVRIEPGEVLEADAAIRLAGMIMGEGLARRDPVQGRVNLVATRKGLVRVDTDALRALNDHPDVGIFTVMDALPVVAGKMVAGAKIGPVAIPGRDLDALAESVAGHTVVQVRPFLPLRAGVVVTEGLDGKVRDRFEDSVCQKMDWYGAEVLGFRYVPDEAAAVAAAMREAIASGAQVILAAGGHMMDPLDATITALPLVGARIVRMGAPAHPGSMFWLGHRDEGDIPVVSLASCSMYSRSTVADLVLPRIMAGERVTSADIAALGHGGMLDRDMQFRFPPYDADAVDEPDEDA